jgi:hypothetical protein
LSKPLKKEMAGTIAKLIAEPEGINLLQQSTEEIKT